MSDFYQTIVSIIGYGGMRGMVAARRAGIITHQEFLAVARWKSREYLTNHLVVITRYY